MHNHLGFGYKSRSRTMRVIHYLFGVAAGYCDHTGKITTRDRLYDFFGPSISVINGFDDVLDHVLMPARQFWRNITRR